jgi:hypothetical protein
VKASKEYKFLEAVNNISEKGEYSNDPFRNLLLLVISKIIKMQKMKDMLNLVGRK